MTVEYPDAWMSKAEARRCLTAGSFVRYEPSAFVHINPQQEEEAMHSLSDTIEGLEQQLEKAAAALAQMKRFGDDDYPAGTIIAFDVTFPAQTRNGFNEDSRTYAYAAIKSPDGLWQTSGPDRPGPFSWSELVQWWTRRRIPTTEVWVVTQFEQVEA